MGLTMFSFLWPKCQYSRPNRNLADIWVWIIGKGVAIVGSDTTHTKTILMKVFKPKHLLVWIKNRFSFLALQLSFCNQSVFRFRRFLPQNVLFPRKTLLVPNKSVPKRHILPKHLFYRFHVYISRNMITFLIGMNNSFSFKKQNENCYLSSSEENNWEYFKEGEILLLHYYID